MDRVWQWAWDRLGPRYSWVIFTVTLVVLLPIYLSLAIVEVGLERSYDAGQLIEAAAVTAAVVLVVVYVMILPGRGANRLIERWAAGEEADRAPVLEASYVWTRTAVGRSIGANAVLIAALLTCVGAMAGGRGVDALGTQSVGLIERGSYAVKGVSAPIEVFGIELESIG
jgi:adenylate cyclase